MLVKKIWERDEFGEKDIEINVKGKIYKLNKKVMGVSEFFKKIDNSRYIENNGYIVLDKVDDIKIWEKLLEFGYGNKCNLNKLRIEEIIPLYKLADMLIVDNLILETSQIIKKNVYNYYNLNNFIKCEYLLNHIYPNLDTIVFDRLITTKMTYYFKTKQLSEEMNIMINYPLIFPIFLYHISLNRNDIYYTFDKTIFFKHYFYNICSLDYFFTL